MNVTESAFERVRKLFELEADLSPDNCLRVYVQGGGCSGFQYGFKIEEAPGEDDLIVESQGVRVVIDPMSQMYLEGATLDYKTGLEGEMFVINNPNATTQCGCGSSFGV